MVIIMTARHSPGQAVSVELSSVHGCCDQVVHRGVYGQGRHYWVVKGVEGLVGKVLLRYRSSKTIPASSDKDVREDEGAVEEESRGDRDELKLSVNSVKGSSLVVVFSELVGGVVCPQATWRQWAVRAGYHSAHLDINRNNNRDLTKHHFF